MGVSLRIVEGPAGPPPDVSKIVATIGWGPGLSVGSGDTEVAQIDSLTGLSDVVGYGLGSEAAARRRRISRVRGLLVPHNASTAGIIGSVTQTGLGPAMSVAANDTHPSDDATVIVKIVGSGAPGVATYQVSVGFNVVSQGNTPRLYGAILTMAERLPATIVGTVDLSTLVYALPATVIGTADLSDPTLYGSGGSLAGKTLIAGIDGDAPITVTLPSGASALADADALVAYIEANLTGTAVDYTNFPYLRILGTDLGTAGEVNITGGTGLALLGLTVSTTNGTAGVLDGKTVILEADTGGSQTVTFGTGTSAPANAAAVVAAVSATTNITASLYSSRNLLKIISDTLGTSSELSITGGNGLALLGLETSTSPAEGAEPTHEIEHLGITCTFAAGTYRSGTTYAFAVTAPRPSASEVEDRLRELDAAGYEFGVVHIAAPLNASDALAMAAALDTLGEEWEGRQGNPRAPRFVIGVDPSETDAVVKATFAAFRSRRVDIAARGAYVSAGLFSGGARVLRSQSWPCADADALLEFYQDRGERRLALLRQGFPEVYALTADENTATVKLVNATGMRFNVMVVGNPGLQFSGGYSSADATSAFTDASVRNTTHVAFLAGYAKLAENENRTDLATESDGTLAEADADRVAVDVADAIADAIVPGGATAVQCTVDTAEDYYSTRRLSGSITFQDRKPAREVSFTIGPGLITEG
jgi:hypothetical protein